MTAPIGDVSDHKGGIDFSLMLTNGAFSARIFGIAGEDYVVEGTTNMVDLSARESILYIGDVGNAPVTVTMPVTNRAGYFRIRWLNE